MDLSRLKRHHEDGPSQPLPASDGRNPLIRSPFCALALIALAFCLPARAGTLRGEAWYRERIALPPAAVFEAALLDVSRADAAGEALGRARREPAGGRLSVSRSTMTTTPSVADIATRCAPR